MTGTSEALRNQQRLDAAIANIEAVSKFDEEQGGFPWELKAQEPNIRAANEHLHRQLEKKDARIAELEAENRLLRAENSFIQNDNATLYAQLNGEAA